MLTKIAIGFIAAALLSLSPVAIAAPCGPAYCTKQAPATLLPRLRLAECRFWPCNCRDECIRWDQNGNCNGTYRTCDTCSKCD